MLDAFVLFLRFFLTVVFGVAAVAKLRDRQGTGEALEGFGVPAVLIKPATLVLPLTEAVAALLLIPNQTYPVGASWVLLLLSAFTAGILLNLSKGKRPACRCFGEASSTPIGAATVARNGMLMAAALLVFLNRATFGQVRRWFQTQSSEMQPLLILCAVMAITLTYMGVVLIRQRRINNDFGTRLASLETGIISGLPIGEAAPAFALPTTEGEEIGLQDLLSPGLPLLLLFTDPDCGPCQALMPEIATWQSSLAHVFTLGVVSRGDVEANQEKVTRSSVRSVMLADDSLFEAYRSVATPSAVIVGLDGLITSAMAHGIHEIRGLLESLVSDHAQHLWDGSTATDFRSSSGMAVGSDLPELTVEGYGTIPQELTELAELPTLLVFWSPFCGYCQQIARELTQVGEGLATDRQIVFATVGSVEENAAIASFRLILDEEFRLGTQFGATGTPSAVWIEDGVVASHLETGTDRVVRLAHLFSKGRAQRVQAPTFLPPE